MEAYGSDLAYIHDTGFGDVARHAAAFLLDALRRRGVGRGLVIDLGCGSGITVARGGGCRLRRPGNRHLGGHDRDGPRAGAAGAISRRVAPRVEAAPCVAVAAAGEGFNYLFDPGNTARALTKLLQRFHGALEPGGLLLFDVAEPGRVAERGPQRKHMEGDDWAVLVTMEEDRRRRLLTRRITTFRRVGDLYRRGQEVHRQRLLPRAEVAAKLRALGFRVRILASYGDLRFVRGQVGFLARKPPRAPSKSLRSFADARVSASSTAVAATAFKAARLAVRVSSSAAWGARNARGSVAS